MMKISHAIILLTTLLSANACLMERELQSNGRFPLSSEQLLSSREPGSPPLWTPVGVGDRFENGTIIPQGVGRGGQPPEEIFNNDEIESAFHAIAHEYPEYVDLFSAPSQTYENRAILGATITRPSHPSVRCRNTDNPQVRAFLQGGIHARERGGPDHILYFLSDLLWADRQGKGLSYGGRLYTNEQVTAALDVGIVVLPNVNPDGLVYDQASDDCWRKNRNPESSSPALNRSIGVDLNRNFDFVWDYAQYFSPAVFPASDDPSTEAFYGTGPFSEPETQNIKWVFDRFPDLGWYLDLHSAIGMVLYGWFTDSLQSDDPAQNFGNAAYDEVRGLMPDGFGGFDPNTAAYGEYIDRGDWDTLVLTAERMSWAMKDAGFLGDGSRIAQGARLYPTSGSSTDWAYSRHVTDAGRKKVLGVGFEFGQMNETYACPFYPSPERYVEDVKEVGIGLMEFLLSASRFG